MAVFVPKFLRSLRDVVLSSPADGEVLTFDSGTSSWRNEAAAGGSQPVVGERDDEDGPPSGVSSIQTLELTGIPTGGNFTLSYDGDTTATIAHDASAGTIQTALDALDAFGTGAIGVTGGPLPDPVTISFEGEAVVFQPIDELTVGTNSLTGGTDPEPVIAVVEPGMAPVVAWVCFQNGTIWVNTGTLAAPVWEVVSKITDSTQTSYFRATDTIAEAAGTALEVYAGPSPVGSDIMGGEADPSAGAGITAPVPAIYMRSNAGAGELWLKTGGAATAWTQIQTVP